VADRVEQLANRLDEHRFLMQRCGRTPSGLLELLRPQGYQAIAVAGETVAYRAVNVVTLLTTLERVEIHGHFSGNLRHPVERIDRWCRGCRVALSGRGSSGSFGRWLLCCWLFSGWFLGGWLAFGGRFTFASRLFRRVPLGGFLGGRFVDRGRLLSGVAFV